MMSPAQGRRNAFTLTETMVTLSIFSVVGLLVLLTLDAGLTLYAKNTAVNSAHQQARSGVDQMLANIHSSVSIPELTDSNLQPVAEFDANGQPVSAAGISFQMFSAGPYPVVVNANATDTYVILRCPVGYAPPASARLNIPSHDIEYDITSTATSGSNLRFNLATPAGGIGTAVSIAGDGIEGDTGVTYIIAAFITARVSYAVVGNELRYFPTNDVTSYRVISRNLISTTPFTVPASAAGGLQNQFLAAVNLSTVDPNFTNRGYAAVNMFISSMIPFRCRLTNSQ
jgi:prepilin-type N-terminal cleavage/methylation domain-containing protein